MNNTLKIFAVCLLLASCTFFKKTEEGDPVARVNESYLYQEDLDDIVPEGASIEDSTVLVNTYINRWARQLLLMDGALLNIPEDKQTEYSKLVEQYRNDLFTKAYLEVLVKKNIDTTVSQKELQVFYQANKESFKLNDNLIQFRYLTLPLNPVGLDTIKSRFKRFKEKDKRYLDSISVQFKAYSLKDSLWVKNTDLLAKIPVLNTLKKEQLLKKSNFLQLKDSLNLYLMQVNNVRVKDDYAPLSYVGESIKQIVINKRKLELIKELENDIIKDAIKNNQFQLYK
ncbi:peptidyl-prolyl cis-trans isomerase [uncultured Winogradskyella sp.]|uniref:peptidyl-prolyl cis-trans isomerase n=1 Tax=uncultured Winogradskyella sp. TaxID=395353 RepID=UPI0026089423|nr:peptidyl-prolyl cis-trans isomerase [uncultured Winogradskyella sp.]